MSEQDHVRAAGETWQKIHDRLEAAGAGGQQGLQSSREKQRQILRERAIQLARPHRETAATAETIEVVEFLLAGETYGIESRYFDEVIAIRELTPVPGVPSFIAGIIAVRGRIFSVVDLRKFFDLPHRGITDLNKVILIQSDQMEFGILADVILGIRHISVAELHPALPTLTGIREDYLKGITPERRVILDGDRLLSDQKLVLNEEVEA